MGGKKDLSAVVIEDPLFRGCRRIGFESMERLMSMGANSLCINIPNGCLYSHYLDYKGRIFYNKTCREIIYDEVENRFR